MNSINLPIRLVNLGVLAILFSPVYYLLCVHLYRSLYKAYCIKKDINI